MLKTGRLLVCAVLLGISVAAVGQDAQQLVQQAVKTELAADAADRTRWLYYEVDQKPNSTVKQWVAETRDGNLERVIEENGQPVMKEEARRKMEHFARDEAAQEKQRKSGRHDDEQAANMLNMMPKAFLWTKAGTQGNSTILQFKPDPHFHPPSFQARVFAAMEGEMTVDNAQCRIVSLKGRLTRDVKIGGGLLAELQAGGTFDVERRETGKGEWQITETHVQMQGHALLFKSISEHEDDRKSKFKQLPGDISFADAEKESLAQSE